MPLCRSASTVARLGLCAVLVALASCTPPAMPSLTTYSVADVYLGDDAGERSLGHAVDVWGDHAIVGIGGGDPGQTCAIILVRDAQGGWTKSTELDPPVESPWDYDFPPYGNAVAIGDGIAAVAGLSGVYIFSRDAGGEGNWGFVKKLTSPRAGDAFGHSLSLHGDRLLVGCPTDRSDTGTGQGSARLYRRGLGGEENWGLEQVFTNEDGSAFDSFGYSVSLSDRYAVIGAPHYPHNSYTAEIVDVSFPGHGWARVYAPSADAGTWELLATLELGESETAVADDVELMLFGLSVDTEGERAVVGACTVFEPPGQLDDGIAFIFERGRDGAWRKTTVLTPAISQGNDRFACSISISGDRVAVGAQGYTTYTMLDYATDREGYLYGGAVFVFRLGWGGNDTWGQEYMLTHPEPDDGHGHFGESVALSGATAIVGAPASLTSGSGHVFELP